MVGEALFGVDSTISWEVPHRARKEPTFETFPTIANGSLVRIDVDLYDPGLVDTLIDYVILPS